MASVNDGILRTVPSDSDQDDGRLYSAAAQEAVVAESLASSDAETAQVDFVAAQAETLAVSDSVTATVDFAATRTESLTVADAETGAVDFVAARTESLTTTAAQAATADMVAARSETLTAADGESGAVDFVATRTESLSSAESQAAAAAFAGATSESLSATDGQSSAATFVATSSESLSASATQSSIGQNDVTKVESLALSDSQDATVVHPIPPPVNQTAGDPSGPQAKRIPNPFVDVQIIGPVKESRERVVFRMPARPGVERFPVPRPHKMKPVGVQATWRSVAKTRPMNRWSGRALPMVYVIARTPVMARVARWAPSVNPRLREPKVRTVHNPSDAELLQLLLASMDSHD